jgi:hypothetical protein
MTQIINITDCASRIARRVLHLGVLRSFVITRSHYENIDLM